jgi:hypothetical protein
MSHRIVILGGGTGGTLAANRLRRMYSKDEAEITVVDQNDHHIYQPGLLFVPFGLKRTEELERSRRHQLHSGIAYDQAPIEAGKSFSPNMSRPTGRLPCTTLDTRQEATCLEVFAPRLSGLLVRHISCCGHASRSQEIVRVRRVSCRNQTSMS